MSKDFICGRQAFWLQAARRDRSHHPSPMASMHQEIAMFVPAGATTPSMFATWKELVTMCGKELAGALLAHIQWLIMPNGEVFYEVACPTGEFTMQR